MVCGVGLGLRGERRGREKSGQQKSPGVRWTQGFTGSEEDCRQAANGAALALAESSRDATKRPRALAEPVCRAGREIRLEEGAHGRGKSAASMLRRARPLVKRMDGLIRDHVVLSSGVTPSTCHRRRPRGRVAHLPAGARGRRDLRARPGHAARGRAGVVVPRGWISRAWRRKKDVVLGAWFLRPNYPGPGAHIANGGFIVAPAARGRGVGPANGRAFSGGSAAARLPRRAVQLRRVHERGAVRLWRELGFEVVGALPGAFRHPARGFVDALVMFRAL